MSKLGDKPNGLSTGALAAQSFRYEKDMVPVVDCCAGIGLKRNGPMFSKREVPIGACIPDMIFVSFDDSLPIKIWPRQWNYMHAFVVWAVRKKNSMSMKSLSKAAFQEEERVKPYVDELIKSGALIVNAQGKLQLAEPMKEIRAQVTAVEIKIAKWKQALNQAKTYRRFADRVFVAIDPAYLSRALKSSELFAESGIGLCSVHPDGLQWAIKPRINSPSHPEREYIMASAASEGRQALWAMR